MTNRPSPTPAEIQLLRDQYEREGYCVTRPVVPQDLLDRVASRMEAMVRGEYETGVPPHAVHFSPEDPPNKLKKIDQPNLSDRTVLELIRHPAIGEWAAALTGASRIQAWAIQLLVKPPGSGENGVVGWHQDKRYWPYWEGEVFTAWVAVSDVPIESGPVRYVSGSHKWGYRGESDFFGKDDEEGMRALDLPEGAEWNEVPAVMPAGAIVFHHRNTFHASGPNTSETARKSFAIHLRTEKTEPVFGMHEAFDYYINDLDDPVKAPILFEA